ncbi:MAG: L-rhamnose/proton symporter RhaT [Thermoguttaceae bacterium]
MSLLFGFSILLLGAMCGGSFGLPSKFVSKTLPWEVLWGPFFLFATILLPVVAGPILVPGLLGIYQNAGFAGLVVPFAFGFLWGLGSMTLGISFAFIGLSLAYAINYGGQIIVGSMGPMLIHYPEKLQTLPGMTILLGVCVCLVGVIVCGRAGILKQANEENNSQATDVETTPAPKKNILPGLILALASGALCACWSIAFSFSAPICDAARHAPFEITDWRNSLPATFLILFGGFFSSCLYCVMKLQQNKTWGKFLSPSAIFAVVIAFVMAVLHDSAVGLFGYGASMIGDLGASVGYAVFMSFAIIVGNFNGFLMGEWRSAGKKAVQWISTGIVILIVAVCILGIGNGWDQAASKTDSVIVEEVSP